MVKLLACYQYAIGMVYYIYIYIYIYMYIYISIISFIVVDHTSVENNRVFFSIGGSLNIV